MSTTAPAEIRPGTRIGLAPRIGLVLSALMSLANVSNGAMSLVDPTAGQLDPTIAPQPVWISLTLLALGLATLVSVVPAWRGNRTALWVVVVTRLVEAWSALMLPFLPGAPSGMWPFIVTLIVVGTVAAGLVGQALRR